MYHIYRATSDGWHLENEAENESQARVMASIYRSLGFTVKIIKAEDIYA